MNPHWSNHWVQAGKVSLLAAREHFVKCAVNLPQNLANADLLSREREKILLESELAVAQRALRDGMAAFRELPAAAPYARQFDRSKRATATSSCGAAPAPARPPGRATSAATPARCWK